MNFRGYFTQKPGWFRSGLLLALMVPSAACWSFNINSGGDTSIRKLGANAFSQPAGNLSLLERLDFSVGNSFFRNPWVMAPSSTTARDGLGPLFNTNGCQNCHIKDGRGHLPENSQDNAVSLLVRISRVSEQALDNPQLGVQPDPVYGTQIQDFAVPGVEPEAKINIDYRERTMILNGGVRVTLRQPVPRLTELAYGPLHQDTRLSLRVAPPMIGLGLLELIPETTLRRIAQEQAASGSTVSGRLNRVWDVVEDDWTVGRFGWKAEQPSLKQQNAAAFNGDIGITSDLFPQTDCQSKQTECLSYPNGGSPELSAEILAKVTFYTQHLAVPKRRNIDDPSVKRGEALFQSAGCVDCHRVSLRTSFNSNQPALSDQLIHPYSDMLLHDMGPELADNRPVFAASGSEWRTPPLWGIGLTPAVSGRAHYLHDGRATTLLEAVLWHGGEATFSRDRVKDMLPEQRSDLISFLKSL